METGGKSSSFTWGSRLEIFEFGIDINIDINSVTRLDGANFPKYTDLETQPTGTDREKCWVFTPPCFSGYSISAQTSPSK